MAGDRGTDIWRSKDGREWRIGRDAEVAWIDEGTETGLKIMSAIPPVFEAYATVELPGTGNNAPGSSLEKWEQLDKEWEHHEAGALAVLSEHSRPQSWWLGYLETGASDLNLRRRTAGEVLRRLALCAYRGWSRAGSCLARGSLEGRPAGSNVSGRSVVAFLDLVGRRLDVHRWLASAGQRLPGSPRPTRPRSRGRSIG